MNCISLWQPWASAIAVGLKSIETRSWAPPHSAIGQPIAIAAAKRNTAKERAWWIEHVRHNGEFSSSFARAGIHEWSDLPFGKVVAVAILIDYASTSGEPTSADFTPLNTDHFWGNFEPGRFAWFLTDIRPLASPVPIVGRQGIFHWDAHDCVPA